MMNRDIPDFMKQQEYRKQGFPATFIGQTITRLVRARSKWKVRNRHAPSCEEPEYEKWSQEQEGVVLTDLETMYQEFCKKAHKYLISHSTMQGENMPHRIIFPDFYYEIIPNKFTVV